MDVVKNMLHGTNLLVLTGIMTPQFIVYHNKPNITYLSLAFWVSILALS